MKILMVCLGNICRSPLAEGILKHKLSQKALNWRVDSAGTSAYHLGEQPDKRSIAIAKNHKIDITDQRARQFQQEDFQVYDLILAMDVDNYNNILRLATSKEDKEKVKMILNFSTPGQNQSVPDPYWDDQGFEHVYDLLEHACDQIITKFS